MRAEQTGQATLLKAYAQEMAQRQTRPAERGGAAAPASEATAAEEGESATRFPRELSKGRLLDIYG